MEHNQAVRRALALIARRPRTERELRERLLPEAGATGTEHAVARLRTLGYVDDAAWARDYVARGRSRERGAALLQRELLTHGIARDDAAAALGDHDELAAALRAGRRRLPTLRRLLPERRAQRLAGFLLRRGFGRGCVEAALPHLLAELDGAALPPRAPGGLHTA